MAARKKIFQDENTRAKIQTTQLIKRLEKHIDASPKSKTFIKDFLQPSQITAALGLLKKTLPDLSAVEHSGEIVHKDANELSDSELANIISTAGSAGTTKQANSKKQPNKVH